MPEKSEGAFRTIREVADWLTVPTHVLRFWESKFHQIAPVKGAGGRRYYRPEDMRLLGGIKVMLHDQGLTIRGVSQKIDDEGVETLMAMSPDLDMPEAVPVRTRRVIRAAGEEEMEEPKSSANGATPSDRGIRKDGPSPDGPSVQPDAQPPGTQPDADPMPEQPVDTRSAPQPSDGPVRDAPAPPQPAERPAPMRPVEPRRNAAVSAPSEPVATGPSEDEEDDGPGPEEEGIGQLGDAVEDELDMMDDMEDGVAEDGIDEDADLDGYLDHGDVTDTNWPTDDRDAEAPVEARRSVSTATDLADAPRSPLGSVEQRRLRRVIRKLRGMIEDVEQELADGSGS